MRYVAAYCLAALGGGTPTVKDLKKIIESIGAEYDADKAQLVIDQMAGRKVNDVIEEGKAQMGTMPVGAASGGGGGAAPAASESAAPKKEEKVEEPEEESDDDMGFGLFD